MLAGDLNPSERRRAEILQDLRELEEEARVEFERYQEQVGVTPL